MKMNNFLCVAVSLAIWTAVALSGQAGAVLNTGRAAGDAAFEPNFKVAKEQTQVNAEITRGLKTLLSELVIQNEYLQKTMPLAKRLNMRSKAEDISSIAARIYFIRKSLAVINNKAHGQFAQMSATSDTATARYTRAVALYSLRLYWQADDLSKISLNLAQKRKASQSMRDAISGKKIKGKKIKTARTRMLTAEDRKALARLISETKRLDSLSNELRAVTRWMYTVSM